MKIEGIQGSRSILDMFRNVMNPVPYKKPEKVFRQEPVKKVARSEEKHKSGTPTDKKTTR
jgi:hypothetical protein